MEQQTKLTDWGFTNPVERRLWKNVLCSRKEHLKKHYCERKIDKKTGRFYG